MQDGQTEDAADQKHEDPVIARIYLPEGEAVLRVNVEGRTVIAIPPPGDGEPVDILVMDLALLWPQFLEAAKAVDLADEMPIIARIHLPEGDVLVRVVNNGQDWLLQMPKDDTGAGLYLDYEHDLFGLMHRASFAATN